MAAAALVNDEHSMPAFERGIRYISCIYTCFPVPYARCVLLRSSTNLVDQGFLSQTHHAKGQREDPPHVNPRGTVNTKPVALYTIT